MKYNGKELSHASKGRSTVEGRLHFRRTGGSIYHGFKERWFKLKGNILYYFDLDDSGSLSEDIPAGAIIIENCTIKHELMGETPFLFSITFLNELDRKLLFSGRSEKDIDRWVSALQASGYESLRKKLHELQTKLYQITGKDPLLIYGKGRASLTASTHEEQSEIMPRGDKASSFISYISSDPSQITNAQKSSLASLTSDNNDNTFLQLRESERVKGKDNHFINLLEKLDNNLPTVENHFGNALELIGSISTPNEIKPSESLLELRSSPKLVNGDNSLGLFKFPPPPQPPIRQRPKGTKPLPSRNLIDL